MAHVYYDCIYMSTIATLRIPCPWDRYSQAFRVWALALWPRQRSGHHGRPRRPVRREPEVAVPVLVVESAIVLNIHVQMTHATPPMGSLGLADLRFREGALAQTAACASSRSRARHGSTAHCTLGNRPL